MMKGDNVQHNNNSNGSSSSSGVGGDVNNNDNKLLKRHDNISSACDSTLRQQQSVSINDSNIDLKQDVNLKEKNNLNISNDQNKLSNYDDSNKLNDYNDDNTVVALYEGNLNSNLNSNTNSNIDSKINIPLSSSPSSFYPSPACYSDDTAPCLLQDHSSVRMMHDLSCISPPSYPPHLPSSSFSPPSSYPPVPSSSFSPPSYLPIPSSSFSPHPAIPSSSSFSPQYTASATCISSPLLSTLTVTPSIHSPDNPPSSSSLSTLFPSIYNTTQPANQPATEKEKEKLTIPSKSGNPQLAQTSNFSSFASSFASSPSTPDSVFSKEILSEPQNEGGQNVYNVGNRERSISQLSTPSSFTSSPPSSFNNKSTNVFSEGSSNSPNPNTRKSFFSYEMLNSALNLNKSRNSMNKCNNDKPSISDLKCSNNNNSSSNNINSSSNNNVNNDSNNNINNNNNSSNNINNSNIDNKSNINNSNNSSSSGSSSNNATAAAAATITEMNQDSTPAKRPLAKYPIPCDSVSTVLIHGFLSQGTEYSFFLPPQAENEFIGKRVSHCFFTAFSVLCTCLVLTCLVLSYLTSSSSINLLKFQLFAVYTRSSRFC